MKPINRVKKIKERLLFLLDDWKELENLKFSKFIPKQAKKIEIVSKESINKVTKKIERILEIDYIISIESKEIKEEK